MPIQLVQYWDTLRAPEEVELLMTTWDCDPDIEYRRFNEETAAAFIQAHFDTDTVTAFRSCRIGAMQADFFRYCALYVFGGVYVDADTRNAGGLAQLTQSAKRGVLMDRRGKIANDFMYFCHPRDRLLERVIQVANANIAARLSQNVWEVTGPGIMTGLYQNQETRPLFDGLDISDVRDVRRIVAFQWDLEYKKGEEDWRAANAGGQSIFKEPSK